VLTSITLGTGRGTSVLELVNAFMKVNDIDVPYEIVGRRPGDIATCFADASKAEKELGWKAELGIDEMVGMLGSLSRTPQETFHPHK
jgi:UDP-glucose 4-epimerase